MVFMPAIYRCKWEREQRGGRFRLESLHAKVRVHRLWTIRIAIHFCCQFLDIVKAIQKTNIQDTPSPT